MLCDSETTNPCTMERTPFLDAYLELVDKVSKADQLRDGLFATLLSPTINHVDTQRRAAQIFLSWEAGELAADRMMEAKQHQEQALSEHATRLLDQGAEITADVLEQTAYRLRDDAMFERAAQLRERARLRRSLTSTAQVSPEQGRP